MNLRKHLLKENIITEELFDEFYNTYGHITKLSTLRLLANDFMKKKQKEKNFNIHKFRKHIKLKYPNVERLITKDELKSLVKSVELEENVDYEEIEKEVFNNENIEKLKSITLDNLFEQFSHAKFFKKDNFYKKIEFEMINKSIKEIDSILKNKEDVVALENTNFKKMYEEKQSLLNKIVNPENIESYYPLARAKKRQIHAFLGPTNSGKTHNAITRLKSAKKGIYLAPLRLLAREIYDDLIANGIKASLITGEEKILVEGATHICSTIEMLDINEEYEVAVIDEIQFLADRDRGNAWSRALIGLAADEIMVVGSTDAKFLIDSIADLCKDNTFHYEYNRLSPLEIEGNKIHIKDLEPGDAIIAFSRRNVHAIAKELEVKHNKKVSLIYGALPPEVRLEESRRFNEGETDILVSTDAIGYGLNLNIQRIIFSSMCKFDGEEQGIISQTVFNQIAGRAGRYGKSEKGFVCYSPDFNKYDEFKGFQKLASKLYEDLPSLESSYYFPEWNALKSLSEETKNKGSMFNLLLNYLQVFENRNEIFQFRFEFLDDVVKYLDAIEGMDIETKYRLMFAPVRESNFYFFEKCVEAVFKQNPYESKLHVHLEKARSLDDLEEITHNALLYMWMNQRHEEYFPSYDEVQKIYQEVSYMIMDILKEGY